MSQKNLLKKIFLSQGHRGHGRKQRKKCTAFSTFCSKQSLVQSSCKRKMLHQFKKSFVTCLLHVQLF